MHDSCRRPCRRRRLVALILTALLCLPAGAAMARSRRAPSPGKPSPSASPASIRTAARPESRVSRPSPDVPRAVEGVVRRVPDGRTVAILGPGGREVGLRLFGLDAPVPPRGSRPGQPHGLESRRVLKEKLVGKRVRASIVDTGRGGIETGVVYLGDRNVNLEILREGHAWAYTDYPKTKDLSEYVAAEKTARSKGLGIWKEYNPMPPWEFRARERRHWRTLSEIRRVKRLIRQGRLEPEAP